MLFRSNLLIRRNSINTFSCETGSAPDFDYLKYSSNLLFYPCAPKGYVDSPMDRNHIYESNTYYISFKFESLSKTKTTTYTSNGNIIEEMEYSYINNLLKTKKKICNGDITDIYTYLYPFDYLQMQDTSQRSILERMTNSNFISTPFLITHTRNACEPVPCAAWLQRSGYGSLCAPPHSRGEKTRLRHQ